MIGILLGILKGIGIVIGIILLILLCILVAVLFVPICYKGKGEKRGKDLHGQVSVSWLLHMLSIKIEFENKNVHVRVRIFGISLDGLMHMLHKISSIFRKRKNNEKKEDIELTEDEVEIVAQESKDNLLEMEEDGKNQETKHKSVSEVNGKTNGLTDDKINHPTNDKTNGSINAKTNHSTNHRTESSTSHKTTNQTKRNKFSNKIKSIYQKVIGFPKKVIEVYRKFTLTIKGMYGNIKEWKSILKQEETKAAIRLVKKKIWQLIKHILPRKIKGKIEFGFSDPALTGQVLAVASVFYPVYGKNISVVPYFEEEVLEGELYLRGRIVGFVFLKIAWELYKDKNIRYIYQKFQSKEG